MKKIVFGVMFIATVLMANNHSLNQCKKEYNECTVTSIHGTAAQYDKQGMKYYRRGNYSDAIVYHKKACSLGYAPGCNHTGYIYDQGQGVKQNYFVARKYFTLACHYKSSIGCLNLAAIYEYGQGVAQSDKKAQKYYQKSCDLGSTEGCNSLNILKHYLMLTR